MSSNEPLLLTLNYSSKGKAVKSNGYLLQLRVMRTLKKVYKQSSMCQLCRQGDLL